VYWFIIGIVRICGLLYCTILPVDNYCYHINMLNWIREHTILCIFIVAFVLYVPSLFGKFVWDDEDFVYANTYVQQFQVGKFFTENAIAGRGGKQSNYYRPIQEMTYSLEYKLVGQNPFLYHLDNNILHALVGVVLYLVLLEIGAPYIIALFTSLFFVIHPVQTEAVSYISGRSDMLYVLFLGLSMLFFLKEKVEKRWYSLLFFVLALLSKETALIGIVLFPAGSWLQNKKIIDSLKRTVPYVLLVCIYLVFRFTILEFQASSVVWGNTQYATSVVVRVSTFFRSYFTYVRLLLFPYGLHMERDLTTPIVQSLYTWWTVFFLLFQMVVLFLCYVLYRVKKCVGKIWVVGYLVFSACLAFYSGIILLNGIFYEHYLYFALLFFYLLLVSGLFSLLPKKGAVVLLSLYICVLMVVNVRRQYVWASPVRFYTQTLSYAPQSVRIRNGLAMAYADEHEIDKAIEEYNKIIKEGNVVVNVYHNLANAYATNQNYAQAERYYLKAIETQRSFHFSYLALVDMYIQTNGRKKLINVLPKLEKMGEGNKAALYAVARGYEFVGNKGKAGIYFELCCGVQQ